LEQFRRWRHGGDAERVASRIQEHPPAPIGLRVYQLGSEGNSLRFGLVEVISCGEIKVNDRLARPLRSLVVLNALHDHDEPRHLHSYAVCVVSEQPAFEQLHVEGRQLGRIPAVERNANKAHDGRRR